ILLRDFLTVNTGRAGQDKVARVLGGAHSLESTGSVVQPDDHIIRVNQVGPDQVIVAVMIYVLDEERAVIACARVKVKDRGGPRLAEPYLNALIASGAAERGFIEPVVPVKVGDRQSLE